MKRTIPAVKDLMNKEESPTFEDLLAIPWETTNELGVYLKLIFENLENPTALSHFVYIGSAILRFAGGLHRRWQHETKPGPKLTSYIYQYYYRLRTTATIIRSGCTPQVTRTSYSPRFSGIHAWGFINCTKWRTCFSWTSK
ncbi:hypothetical protein RU639_006942 [Aspergillus parasiticus]